MNINDLTVTSIEVITAYSVSGDYMFTLDELQSATIAQAQEQTDITGKQGRKLNTLKKNKSVTISGTNGLMSSGLMEIQTGGKFESKTDATVLWADYLTVTSNKATTTYKAVGTAGTEIDKIVVKDGNGLATKELKQVTTVSAGGQFEYSPDSKELTFNTNDITDGTEIVVYYKRKIAANVLSNMSDKYSGKCALYVDGLAEDKCANVYRIQFFIPKADFSGEFSMEFGGDQSVHAFEAEALAGACGVGGALWTYTLFGVDTDDAQ